MQPPPFVRRERHNAPRSRQQRSRARTIAGACSVSLALSSAAVACFASPAQSAVPAPRLIASDTFHRTVASGLGRADMGGTYRLARTRGVAVAVADGREL